MPIRPENRDRYPPDWREVRNRILRRAAGEEMWDQGFEKPVIQCECRGECGRGHTSRCPAFDGEAHPDTGAKVVLTIAHLDHQPEHCEESNLRAMCQACHLAYDAEHHAAERWRNARLALEAAGQGDMFK